MATPWRTILCLMLVIDRVSSDKSRDVMNSDMLLRYKRDSRASRGPLKLQLYVIADNGLCKEDISCIDEEIVKSQKRIFGIDAPMIEMVVVYTLTWSGHPYTHVYQYANHFLNVHAKNASITASNKPRKIDLVVKLAGLGSGSFYAPAVSGKLCTGSVPVATYNVFSHSMDGVIWKVLQLSCQLECNDVGRYNDSSTCLRCIRDGVKTNQLQSTSCLTRHQCPAGNKSTCWDEADCQPKPSGEVCIRDGDVCHVCTGVEGCPETSSECITDVDECNNGAHICDANATCDNRVGSYKCMCNQGYTGNGKNCTDINECSTGAHDCDKYATCGNREGYYICSCWNGYFGDGKSCSETDGCSSGGKNECHARATCLVLPDNVQEFVCTCDNGYTGDGKNSCTDVAECSDGTHNCSAQAKCTNTIGSYTCKCDSGYAGDGDYCSDPTSPMEYCTSQYQQQSVKLRRLR